MSEPKTASNLIDLGKFEAMIEAAPEAPQVTEEQLRLEAETRILKARDAKLHAALGPRTGWESRYLEAAKTSPHGEQWLDAFTVAKAMVEANGIVVLYGSRGGGKTRMAAELSVIVGSSRYRTAMRFFLEVRSTFRKDADRSELDVIDELAGADLLTIDEVQERGETDFENRLLTHVIDARYAAQKPTILIANLVKAQLAKSLGPSIVDRARENGKSIEFNWPSYRK